MYNEEIKKRYIQEKEATTSTPENYLERLFNKTKGFEGKLEKDVSSFTVYEIMDTYKTINSSSFETLLVMHNHLSLYTQWCLHENLVPDCQNHFVEIKNEALLNCINKVILEKAVITRKRLYFWLAQMDNPSDAFVMLCLFEGIKGQAFCEIANLRISDFSGNTVKLCTGRELTVSDKLIELAKLTDETYVYHTVSKTNSKEYMLEDEGYLIKKYHNCKDGANEEQRGRRIYKKLFRNFEEKLEVKDYMKSNSLITSGMIDFINTRAKELEITAKDYLFSKENHVLEVKERYGYDMKRLRKMFYAKYEEYLI